MLAVNYLFIRRDYCALPNCTNNATIGAEARSDWRHIPLAQALSNQKQQPSLDDKSARSHGQESTPTLEDDGAS